MLAELEQQLSQKTGLPPEKAQEAVNFVIAHLRDRLPAPLSSLLDHYLNGGSLGAPASGATSATSLIQEAEDMAARLGLGKKPQ